MRTTLAEKQDGLEGPFVCADITLVVGVRLHERNPWVLERLERISRHYTPCPQVLVVDFGSAPEFAEQIRRVCLAHGYRLQVVDDRGVFCPAKAKNVGAQHVQTPLIFFCDIDCFGASNLFERLARAATASGMRHLFDVFMSLPVYHLTQERTDSLLADGKTEAQLDSILYHAPFYGQNRGRTEFTAPYSNCFLCRRDFYFYIGGQNEAFRGHGSEDFEFLVRSALAIGQLPLPKDLTANVFGPLHKGYFGRKPYRGFRRLLELLTVPAELEGLRVAHLAHPRPQRSDDWWRDHVAKRAGLFEALERCLRDGVAEFDFMPRQRQALVRESTKHAMSIALPLRLMGYRVGRASGTQAPSPDGPEQTVHVSLSETNETLLFQRRGETWEILALSAEGAREPVGEAAYQLGQTGEWVCTSFLFRGRQLMPQRVCAAEPFDESSYATARLGLLLAQTREGRRWRRLQKLVRNPRRFFLDSQSSALQRLAKWL